jgi:hypothetical protein
VLLWGYLSDRPDDLDLLPVYRDAAAELKKAMGAL